MATNIPSVAVTGYVQASPNDRYTFIKVLQAHIPRVRRKDGCIAYSFAVDVLYPKRGTNEPGLAGPESSRHDSRDDEFQATMKELASLEIVARNVQKYAVLRQPIFRPELPADHLCEACARTVSPRPGIVSKLFWSRFSTIPSGATFPPDFVLSTMSDRRASIIKSLL